ncbi:MAG: NAD(P)-binding domain-containing protein [Bdellovibrionales bacterium]|nr:NAD(P)-binding domain-containing protein [Bdellovibrionales bacterium]
MTASQGKATREEYLLYLRSLVSQFNLEISFNRKVTNITKQETGEFRVSHRSSRSIAPFEDNSTAGASFSTQIVVLAIGDMHAPNLLSVRGEELPCVSHYFVEPHMYFGKSVLVVGGKNSAVEAAIRLYRVGARVTLSYRGGEFDSKRVKYWLYPELLHLIRNKSIRFFPHSRVSEITRNGEVVFNSEDKTFKESFDEILLLTGYRQDPSLFEQIGIELVGNSKRPKLNEETMESHVKGVFVIGTAVAGSQIGGVKEYIETSHVHVDRVIQKLFGESPSWSHYKSDKEFLET